VFICGESLLRNIRLNLRDAPRSEDARLRIREGGVDFNDESTQADCVMARFLSPLSGSPTRTVQILCYLLLGIGSWCGPIPWIHCHGQAGGSGAALSEHRQLHHTRTQEPQGWHFHLLLLTEFQSEPCGEDCPERHHQAPVPAGWSLAYGVSVVKASPTGDMSLPLAVLDWAIAAPAVVTEPENSSRVERPASDAPGPLVNRLDLLCVARC